MTKYTPYLLLVSLVLLAFSPVLFSFFQQDEWLAFGYHFLAEQQGIKSVFTNAFIPRLGHYSPLNYLTEYLLFLLFRLNYLPWAVTSIVFHIANSIAVYILARSLFEKTRYALGVSALFAVSAAGLQATAWPVADIGTHGATFFALIAFNMWTKKGKHSAELSVVMLGVSLLFKEIAVAFFVLLPLWSIVKKHEDVLKRVVCVSILFVVFVSVRASALLLPADALTGTIYDQPVESVSQSPAKALYNIVTFPAKGVTQSIVAPHIIISLSQRIAASVPTRISGEPLSTKRDIFVLKYIVEICNFAIFFVVAFLALRSRKYGVYFLAFVMLNAVIYSLSPERTGRITLIDSRNLYFLSAGSSLLVVTILRKLPFVLYGTIIISLLVANVYLTFQQSMNIANDTSVRKQILTQISNENPDLPDKVIFYIESDSSYFGLPEETRILPFQSGIGQTLLVWFYQNENFPSAYLERKYLWGISDQGYKEIDGRGFGYFREKDKLLETMKEYSLQPSSVIMYNWYSESEILIKGDFTL